MRLALDALLNRRGPIADSVVLDLAPGILGHADLVPADGLSDVRHLDRFGARQLRDRA